MKKIIFAVAVLFASSSVFFAQKIPLEEIRLI